MGAVARKWTPAGDAVIRSLYDGTAAGVARIIRRCPDRTQAGVRLRAWRLGVTRPQPWLGRPPLDCDWCGNPTRARDRAGTPCCARCVRLSDEAPEPRSVRCAACARPTGPFEWRDRSNRRVCGGCAAAQTEVE